MNFQLILKISCGAILTWIYFLFQSILYDTRILYWLLSKSTTWWSANLVKRKYERDASWFPFIVADVLARRHWQHGLPKDPFHGGKFAFQDSSWSHSSLFAWSFFASFSRALFLIQFPSNIFMRIVIGTFSCFDFRFYWFENKMLIKAMSNTRLLLSSNCCLQWIIFLARSLVFYSTRNFRNVVGNFRENISNGGFEILKISFQGISQYF